MRTGDPACANEKVQRDGRLQGGSTEHISLGLVRERDAAHQDKASLPFHTGVLLSCVASCSAWYIKEAAPHAGCS